MELPAMSLNEISFGFIEMLQPLMAITLAMVIALALKDWATNLVAGIKFKWDDAWYEGQPCYVDNEPAIIIKISISETIFAIQNGRGTVWVWVCVWVWRGSVWVWWWLWLREGRR